MNGITYFLKSLLLVSLDLERCFHQISACCLCGSWFTVIWHNLSTLFAHENLVLWKVSFSKTWNRSCTLHSFCHKLGTIGIWPVCQLIVMISSSPACTYSSRWSWTLVPTPTTSWNVIKNCKRLWYSMNFGGDQTINIVDEGFMQMEYIEVFIYIYLTTHQIDFGVGQCEL